MTEPTERPNRVLVVLLLAGVSFALSQTLVIPSLPTSRGRSTPARRPPRGSSPRSSCRHPWRRPIVGKLGDLHGKGRVLTMVMLLFSARAVVNALAESVEVRRPVRRQARDAHRPPERAAAARAPA